MPSSNAFKIMEAFAELVTEQTFKEKLIYALNGRKPFRNFKYEIDYIEDYRQKWFKFKSEKYQDWVRTIINNKD